MWLFSKTNQRDIFLSSLVTIRTSECFQLYDKGACGRGCESSIFGENAAFATVLPPNKIPVALLLLLLFYGGPAVYGGESSESTQCHHHTQWYFTRPDIRFDAIIADGPND